MADFALDPESFLKTALGQLAQPISSVSYNAPSTAVNAKQLNKTIESRDMLDMILNGAEDQLNVINETEKGQTRAVGKAEADKALTEQQRSQAVADLTKQWNDLFGLDPSSSIGILAKRVQDTKPQADAELAKIKEMQSVGPLDNPLEWLVNGLQLPSKISAYNRTANQINSDTNLINDGIQQATNASQQATKGIPTITIGMAKADADKKLAEAEVKAANLDKAYQMTKINIGNTRLAADMSLAKATENTTQLEIQNESKKFEKMLADVQMADSHANRLLAVAKLAETIQGTEAEKVILRRAEGILGYEPGSLTVEGMKRLKPDMRANIEAVGQSQSLGTNPVDAMETVRIAGLGPNASEDLKKMTSYVAQKVRDLKETIEVNQKIAPERKAAKLYVDVGEAIKLDMKNGAIQLGMFHEFSPAKMLATFPALTESEIGKALAPLATKDQEVMPPQVAEVFLASSDGNVNKASNMLQQYYRQNIDLRNATIPYTAFGIKPTESYVVQAGGMFNKVSLDLTKPGDATKYINFLILSRKLVTPDTTKADEFRGL